MRKLWSRKIRDLAFSEFVSILERKTQMHKIDTGSIHETQITVSLCVAFHSESFKVFHSGLKTLWQKSHSSLAGGMNATNLWYNAPIHSYLRQEVSEVTPLEI